MFRTEESYDQQSVRIESQAYANQQRLLEKFQNIGTPGTQTIGYADPDVKYLVFNMRVALA